MRGITKQIHLTTKREYAIMCQQCRVDWLSKGALTFFVKNLLSSCHSAKTAQNYQSKSRKQSDIVSSDLYSLRCFWRTYIFCCGTRQRRVLMQNGKIRVQRFS